MNRINKFYYICEKGHVTTGGSDRKKKCDQPMKDIVHEKGTKSKKTGKQKWNIVFKETGPCGSEIKDVVEIPEKLKLSEVWDRNTMIAFMEGQKASADFMLSLQRAFSNLHERVKILEKGNE
jgi:hypothetical protein